MKLVTLTLTCNSAQEGHNIAHSLLTKHLVACVKQMPIQSTFVWQGAIEQTQEILLIMESTADKCSVIEAEVKKLHSYQTFVLTATDIVFASTGVAEWVEQSLQGEK